MSTNSGSRSRLRLGAIAIAVVVGAGAAFVYVGTGDKRVAVGPVERTEPPGPSTTTTTTTTKAEPAPSPVLPFNAKLTSQDIPVPGGGVRSGACSGALIAPEWVVTAGHCFHDLDNARIGGKPPFTVTVVVGRLKDSDPGGHTAQVVDVRQSPVNDLAVVRLSEAVDDIAPVTLTDRPPSVGERLQFAGWGSLSAAGLEPSDHLKRGRFTVTSVEPTTLQTEPIGKRTVENSPCPQDSGAPFFVSDDDRTGRLVAVVNTGPPCPQPGPEIVARVDVVADWIRQQIGSR